MKNNIKLNLRRGKINTIKSTITENPIMNVSKINKPQNYWTNLQSANLSKKVISRITRNESQSPITLIMKEDKSQLISKSKPVLNIQNAKDSLQNLIGYKVSGINKINLNQLNLNSKVLKKENNKGLWTTKPVLQETSKKLNNFLRANINYKLLNSNYPNYNIEVSKLLKSFFVFNVFLAKSQNIVYNFNKSQEKVLSSLESILNDTFRSMKALISRPILEINGQKIIIQLFFFFKNITNNRFRKNHSIKFNKKNNNKKNTLMNLFNNKFNPNLTQQSNNNSFLEMNKIKLEFLAQILSKLLKKNVEFELIRLHYPINESQILAKSVAILGNIIRRRFKYFVNASFKSANIINPTNYNLNRKMKKSLIHNASTSITGIRMKLGGRILAQKIVPRFTSQTYQEGSLTRTNASIVTSSRFSSKNRKGAYSITVSMGHKFF